MLPLRSHRGSGVVLDDGSFQLPERAICFEPHTEYYSDCMMQVLLDDALVFDGKVTHPKAASIGVERDPGGFYFVDRLRIP